ncbi:carboxypeptidase M32 [Metabacillus sp. GX 13764]|uniref:carboxypeptidase M32 n=1 Tax=Metabacillus kandeliae TaxID=2900151 RepID=UPI001E513111|nr:carboxypeptidase M32 [Metabacillus kandeliae]MCD7033422.1 carboxypeptidase M32 [Metabacillus kandeliae]
MQKTNSEEKFYALLEEISNYNEALNVMYWDLRTGAPKKGVEKRSRTIGTLAAEVFKLKTSKQMKQLIDELSAVEGLSERTLKALEEAEKEYVKYAKIPEEEYKQYVMLQTKAESVWEEAREKADYSLFSPYLKQFVEYNQRFVDYWGFEGNRYNTLLQDYEPGMTVDILDRVFRQLKQSIVPLVKEIAESSAKPKTDFLFETFPADSQRKLNRFFLEEIGYDFSAGRLDETVHPFATAINQNDVRITTRYDEKDFRMAVFGTIHECGHALYEQNISPDLEGTGLSEGTSFGIHESQSLFFENFIARHKGFWQKYYETFKSYADGQFDAVSLDDFYFAINESKPSLIRIEADELTYSLHIMIRYEIEKALFNGEADVEELPALWNKKYEEYLGITPPDDAKGILQDVHWSGGSFGYFPSYALGYMYAAQFKKAMVKDLPNFDQLVEKGEFKPIVSWLNEKIHVHGKMKKPLELLQEVTGEELNPACLIEELNSKYRMLYQL